MLLSGCPVYDGQARNLLEIRGVSGDENASICQGNGRDAQVLTANSNALLFQLLIDTIGVCVVIKDVKLCQVADRLMQVSVGPRSRVTINCFADLRQAPAQLLLGSNNRNRYFLGRDRRQSLTDLRMTAEDQAEVIR